MPQFMTATNQDEHWWEGGQPVDIGETFDVRKLNTPLDKMTRSTGGRRSTTKTKRKRGRYIQARPSPGDASDLAFDATLRAAAPEQLSRDKNGLALAVRSDDYQKKVRVRKASNLILFLVDASWSMAVAERMQATKGAIMSLLTDAYQRRDRVGLVVFQKDQARVVLPPTNSVELAQKALKDIPVGGKTPLSAGLNLAHQRHPARVAAAQGRDAADDRADRWGGQRFDDRHAGARGSVPLCRADPRGRRARGGHQHGARRV